MAKQPTETLSAVDAATAKELILLRGLRLAAIMLGIEQQTLLKAIVPLPVHRLTAATIRAKLRSSRI